MKNIRKFLITLLLALFTLCVGVACDSLGSILGNLTGNNSSTEQPSSKEDDSSSGSSSAKPNDSSTKPNDSSDGSGGGTVTPDPTTVTVYVRVWVGDKLDEEGKVTVKVGDTIFNAILTGGESDAIAYKIDGKDVTVNYAFTANVTLDIYYPEKGSEENQVTIKIKRIYPSGDVVDSEAVGFVGQTLADVLKTYGLLDDTARFEINGKDVALTYVLEQNIALNIYYDEVPPMPEEVTIYLTVYENGGKQEYVFTEYSDVILADLLLKQGISKEVVDTYDFVIDKQPVLDPYSYELALEKGVIYVEALQTTPPKTNYIVTVDVYGPDGKNLTDEMIYVMEFVFPPEEQEGLTVGTVVQKYLSAYTEIGGYHLSLEFVKQYCDIKHYDKGVTVDSAIGASVHLNFYIKEGAPKADGEVKEGVLTVRSDLGDVLGTYPFKQTTPPTLSVYDILMNADWFTTYGASYSVPGEAREVYPSTNYELVVTYMGGVGPVETIYVETYVMDASGNYQSNYNGEFPRDMATVGEIVGRMDIVEYAYKYYVNCSCGESGTLTAMATHMLNAGDKLYFARQDGETYPGDGGGEGTPAEMTVNVLFYDHNGVQYAGYNDYENGYAYVFTHYLADTGMTYRNLFESVGTLYLDPYQAAEVDVTYDIEINGMDIMQKCVLKQNGKEISFETAATSGTVELYLLEKYNYEVSCFVCYGGSENPGQDVKSFDYRGNEPRSLLDILSYGMEMQEGEGGNEYDNADIYAGNFVWYVNGKVVDYNDEIAFDCTVFGVKKTYTVQPYVVTVKNGSDVRELKYEVPTTVEEALERAQIDLTDKTLFVNDVEYNNANFDMGSFILMTDTEIVVADRVKTAYGKVLNKDGTLTDVSHKYTGTITVGEFLEAVGLKGYIALPSYSDEGALAEDTVLENGVLILSADAYKPFTVQITYGEYNENKDNDPSTAVSKTVTLTLNRPTWSLKILEKLENVHEILRKGFAVYKDGVQLMPNDVYGSEVLLYEAGNYVFDHEVYWFNFNVEDDVQGVFPVRFASKTQLTIAQILAKAGFTGDVTDYTWEIDGYASIPGEDLQYMTSLFPTMTDYTAGECGVYARIAKFYVNVENFGSSNEMPRTYTVAKALEYCGIAAEDVRQVEVYFNYDSSNVKVVTDFTKTLKELSSGIYFDVGSTPNCTLVVKMKAVNVEIQGMWLNDQYINQTYYQFKNSITIQQLLDEINKVNGTNFVFADFTWRGYKMNDYGTEIIYHSANDVIEEDFRFDLYSAQTYVSLLIIDGEEQTNWYINGAPTVQRLKEYLLWQGICKEFKQITVYYEDGTVVTANDGTNIAKATKIVVTTK